ncbi:MAG: hypothetical protein K9M57_07080, partial [Phycisphaerae bacterium]|nr:hypothetical protein [Phycisphaerae bacterium]
KGHLNFNLNDQGKVRGTVDISQLVSANQVKPEKAKGTLTLVTDENIAIGPIVAFLDSQMVAGGQTGLRLDVSFGGGKVVADLSTSFSGVHIAEAGVGHLTPTDMKLVAHVEVDEKALTARADLSGDPGAVEVRLTAATNSESKTAISSDELVAAMLGDGVVVLPEFLLQADGRLDIKKLAAAIPAVLNVQKDVTITDGEFLIDKLSFKGGAVPQASGAVQLKGLAAMKDKKAIACEPVTARFDMALEPKVGLKINQANVTSAFTTVSVKGVASDIQGAFNADLDKLQGQLGEFFDLTGLKMAGTLAGSLDLARVDEKRIDLGMKVTGENLSYKAGEDNVSIKRVVSAYKGHLELADQKLLKLVASDIAVDIDSQVVGKGSGWYDIQNGAAKGNYALNLATFGYVQDKIPAKPKKATAPASKEAVPERYDGRLAINGDIDRANSQSQWLASGEGKVTQITLNKKPLIGGDVTLGWKGVKFMPGRQVYEAALLSVTSEIARLNVKDVRWAGSSESDKASMTLDGQVDLWADIQKCLDVQVKLAAQGEGVSSGLKPDMESRKTGLKKTSDAGETVGRKEGPPEIAGLLNWSGVCRSEAGVLHIDGNGAIADLVIGRGEQVVREEKALIKLKAAIDPEQQVILINASKIDSQMLTVELAGSVKKYQSAKELDLKGSYRGSWERLMALLHQFVPETAETINLAGVTQSEFKITGPAHQAKIIPVYRDIDGNFDIAWDSGQVYGMKVGAAKLSPRMQDGQVVLGDTFIPVEQGKIRLEKIRVDVSSDKPTMQIAGKVQLLDQVPVNDKMGDQLLSRINPLFGMMARMAGAVSLEVEDVFVPLYKQEKRNDRGKGVLNISEMRMMPKGQLLELMQLAGVNDREYQRMKVGVTKFTIGDNRLTYDDLTLWFNDTYALTFFGSVGFDDTLDLTVSIPISIQLLDKMKVRGAVGDYVRLLAGARVDIPMTGTRQNPQLNFGQVDLKPLIDKAVKALIKEQSGNLLDDLLGGKKKKEKNSPDGNSGSDGATEKPKEKSVEREVFDIFMGVLEGQKEKEKKDKR